MNLSEAFERFKEVVEIDPDLVPKISTKEKLVREALQKAWMGNPRIFFSGSYGRSTKVSPLKDVDLFAARDETYREISRIPHTPQQIRQELYAFLQRLFPGESIRPQRHSVGIEFLSLPLAHRFRMDVVPGVRKTDGGFYIVDIDPEGAARWMFTDPDAHAQAARGADAPQRTGGMAIPLVKMLKTWSRDRHAGLKSFHLETMVFRALDRKPASYAEGARNLFEALTHAVHRSCGDPGRSNGRLDDYLDKGQPGQREVASRKAADASRKMGEAIAAAGRGEHATAVRLALEVFGPMFPR